MFFFNGIVDGMVEHVWIAFHIARDYTSMIELTEEGSVGVALHFLHLSYLGASRCGKYPSGSHGSSLVQQQRRGRQWTALGDRSASCSMICPRQATTPPRPDMLGARWCRRQRTVAALSPVGRGWRSTTTLPSMPPYVFHVLRPQAGYSLAVFFSYKNLASSTFSQPDQPKWIGSCTCT
jgi:hypothetical protein